MKFLLIGLCFTFANAITHHSGYNYPPNNANTGFVPNNGPCCQELAVLKQQLAQQQQQLQQYQQQGRIVHKHEPAHSSLNSVHDSSGASVHSKGSYTHQNQGPVVGNAEFSGTKVFNYHSQGPISSSPGQIHYVNNNHHGNSGQLSSATSGGSSINAGSSSSSKGYNYQHQASTAGGQVVQGHLLVANHAGPVNGPSAAQQIANKYTAHANNAYNQVATTILKPPAPQGGFTVSQTASGYNTNSNSNYNGAGSQHYSSSTKLTPQGSGNYASGFGSSSIGGSSVGYNGNYAGSASDKTYTQTQVVNSNDYSLSGSAGVAGQVEKHIYVHVPPEDFSDSSEERGKLQQLVQPKKHYKIIFIKAPTVSAGPNYQQLLSQNGGLAQEKTLVYVLVKKPDEPSAEEIAAIQNQSVKHHKPEVFFIKYKTRKEAEQAVQSLGQGHGPFAGNFVGSDLGVDVRNAGSHEGLSSVASAIETAEAYSQSSGSSSSSSGSNNVNEVSSSYIPPAVSIPKPAPVYGVPSVKK